MVRQVITDWDETVTKVDTIRFLAEAAYIKKPHYTPPFSYFSDVYQAALDNFNADKNMVAFSELQYQQHIKSVELTSIREIERLNLFQGLSKSDFRAVSERVEIHADFLEFLEACNNLNIPVAILSVNWTKTVIEEVLRKNGVDPTDMKILVNEFVFDGNNVCTGRFDDGISIRTGYDKLKLVQSFEEKDYMYIGDSRTDLLSIFDSKVGVIFKKESTREKARSMGVKVLEKGETGDTGVPYVYYAEGWRELIALLKTD
ncbi:hypothetical protein CLIB1423_07S02278 [[Candida] railenensis]|uniref:Uncharacterized protein n=1 Tax=[Candida] railenensis TaxID=45579 RepID=A0A9P0QQ52_9ASCO|nr:hypothetical protein CLIB1423_07S02278 [[Candida] railenensis]